MEKYNYYEAVYDAVKQYMSDNIELSDYYDEDSDFNISRLEEDLNDMCWTDDAVTGNESGSYTFNRSLAAEYLSHNWDLMEEAANEGFEPQNRFGFKPQDRFSPEVWDVCVRCYLLRQAVAEVCEELEETVKLKYGKDVVMW